jgi:hypothetical protein
MKNGYRVHSAEAAFIPQSQPAGPTRWSNQLMQPTQLARWAPPQPVTALGARVVARRPAVAWATRSH